MQARVLLVTSEVIPLIKTGGLADAIGALAPTLQRQGIDVTVLMPAYPSALERVHNLRRLATLKSLPGGTGKLLHGHLPDSGVPVALLSTKQFAARTANPYVDSEGGEYADNAVSFAALAFAAASICSGKTPLPVPHVVHANDWHAGLIPALLRLRKIGNVASVLTIHNLAFQGNYPLELGLDFGIPAEMLTPDTMEFWGKISYLKAGIRYADRITTVSKSYAHEILTPEFGHGMEGILNMRRNALVAIPNGIDEEVWNPAYDPLIARPFTAANMKGKSGCKWELQKLFGLPVDPFAPVLALGSRITHQKMADVALAALPAILQRHPRMQVVVLGCGDHKYEQEFLQLARNHVGRIGVHIGYEERLAHALHAGADMLLHGSRFEPYGLTPLYSMRYGTIPIASRVGGLIDTITDAGSKGRPPANATGILFDGQQPEDMAAAVDRAYEIYSQPADWQAMQRNAMSISFSWDGPARSYIQLYENIAPASARHWFAAALASPGVEHIQMPQPRPAEVEAPAYMTA